MSATLLSWIVFGLILSLMIFIHELGHFVTAKMAGVKVEEFGMGFPPRLFGYRRGETLYSLNAIPIGGFVRMLGEEDPTQPRSFARARKRWRIAILLAGSTMNLVAASLIFAAAHATGWPTVTGVEINRVMPGSPAEQAGLQPGDAVVAIAGRPVTFTTDLRRVTDENLGRPVPLEVRRAGSPLTVSVTPRTQWAEGDGPIGVGIMHRVEMVRYGPIDALTRGVREVARTVAITAAIPYLLLRELIPPEAARPVGPVGLFQVTSAATAETVRTGQLFYVLSMAATLGAGLGIANLLPIPGLDGGRLLFVGIELIRRRRVSPEREGLIHLVGMAVLLSLVMVITYYDILSPVTPDFTLR